MSGASLALTVALCPSVVEAQSSPPTDSSVVHAARRALSEGRPFLASRLLAPLLGAPRFRIPTRCCSAPAPLPVGRRGGAWSASWTEWSGSTGWRTERSRSLLARARVERSEDAVLDAHAAVATAPPGALGRRLVTLARAFDRAGVLDSAAATYLRAASQLPKSGTGSCFEPPVSRRILRRAGCSISRSAWLPRFPACAGLKPPPWIGPAIPPAPRKSTTPSARRSHRFGSA